MNPWHRHDVRYNNMYHLLRLLPRLVSRAVTDSPAKEFVCGRSSIQERRACAPNCVLHERPQELYNDFTDLAKGNMFP